MNEPLPDDQLPQTTQVFDAPKMEADAHDWQQQGYHIIDACNPQRHDCHSGGIPIGFGKMLVKKDGRYDIVDETRSQ